MHTNELNRIGKEMDNKVEDTKIKIKQDDELVEAVRSE